MRVTPCFTVVLDAVVLAALLAVPAGRSIQRLVRSPDAAIAHHVVGRGAGDRDASVAMNSEKNVPYFVPYRSQNMAQMVHLVASISWS